LAGMVGPCKKDLKHTYYRDHTHAIASGVDAGKVMAELYGRDGEASETVCPYRAVFVNNVSTDVESTINRKLDVDKCS